MWWFWLDHGWIITGGIWAFYGVLAAALVWLVRRILRTESAVAFMLLCSLAIPIAVALTSFVTGVGP